MCIEVVPSSIISEQRNRTSVSYHNLSQSIRNNTVLEPLILYCGFVALYVDTHVFYHTMLYVVRGLYRLAQRCKGRERSRQRTEVRPENLFGVCAVSFVCLFLLNFARVSKCLFWYAVNRQISLCNALLLYRAEIHCFTSRQS